MLVCVRTERRILPVVLSIELVPDLLAIATNPGHIFRTVLSIFYGAGIVEVALRLLIMDT